MHVMEEMPFSHGCHDLVAEPEEAVGRLMDMSGACQAKSVQSINRLAALDQLNEHRNHCLVFDREES